MSSNNQPLSGNSIAPIQKVSLNSLITSVILDADPNDSSFLVKTGNNSSLYVDKYSNVGINTTSPGAQLEVSSANGSCIKLRYGSTSATSSISMNNSGQMSLTTSGNEIITSSNLNISSHNGTTSGLKLNNSLVVATASQLNYNTVTAGTAVAGKVLVVDENRNITNVNTITSTNLIGTVQTASQPFITQVGTLSNLNITGDLTVSGSFNLTGGGGGGSIATSLGYLDGVTVGTASASKALILDANKSISTISSLGVTTLVLGGNSLGATQASYLTGNTAGTAIASKALVVDVNKNITSINSLSASTLTGTLQTAAQPLITSLGSLSSLTIGSATLNEEQANYLTSVTLGTASASKALVVDTNRDITNIRYLTATQINGQIQTASQPLITSLGTLNSLTVSGVASVQSTTEATSSTDGGALTVSGGLAVAKSAFIGSHLIVGGNLTVNGTTTTVNTTNVSIKDNTIQLNASPSGSYDSGLIISRYQTANNASTGDVVTDTAKVSTTITAATSSTATLSSGSAIDNYYNGWWIKVNSEVRKVTSYVGSTRVLTLETTFNSTPTNGTAINLFNKSFAAIVWNEANKQFVSAFTSADSASTLTMLDEADMKVSNLFTSAKIIVNDVTDSSATTNGSIITSGGLGIAKTLRVGTGIYGTLQTASQTNITAIGTLSSLIVSGSITVGGTALSSTEINYLTSITLGTATASKALLIDASKNISGINILGATTLSLGGTSLTTTEANYLTAISTGTASASKALIVDGNRDIVNIRNLTATNLTGQLQTAAQPNITSIGTLTSVTIGSSTLTGTQAAYLTGIISGTSLASKALILDASSNISGINSIGTTTLVLGSTSLTTVEAAYLTSITTGVSSASKALILDASSNISGINSIGTTTLVLGGTSLGATQAGYLTGITPGTALGNKALILNSGAGISGITSLGTTTLVLGGTSLGVTQANYLTGITTGISTANKALVVNSNNQISGLSTISMNSNYLNMLTMYCPPMTGTNRAAIILGKAAAVDQQAEIAFIYNTTAGLSYLSLGHMGSLTTLNVLSNGNVGVGTISPGYKLDVNGSLNATSLYLNGSAFSITPITGVTPGTAAASKALILDDSLNITGVNSISTTTLIVNGVNITSGGAAASPYVTDVTPGTAIASKALIVDASVNITGINTIGATTLTLGATSLTTTEAAYLTGITAGTALASKALIVDASRNIVNINSLTASTLTGTLQTAAQTLITSVGTLTSLNVSGNSSLSTVTIGGATVYTDTLLSAIDAFTAATETRYIKLGKAASDSNLAEIAFTYDGLSAVTNSLSFGFHTVGKRMTIRANGNVGIGTTTPSYKLDVAGDINLTGAFRVNGTSYVVTNVSFITGAVTGTATANKTLIVDASKNITGIANVGATSLTLGSNVLTSTEAGYLTSITTPGTVYASKALVVDVNKNIAGIGYIGLTGQNVMLDLYAATSTNRSAINLRNDTRTVEVGLQGTTATSNADLFYIYSNAAYRLLMNSNGNMGIGATPNASYNLNTTSFNATSYFLNGTTLNMGSIALLPATATGTAAASTALVLDASLNISGINSIGTTTLVLGGTSLTSTQAGYLTGNTIGTAVANKALVVDASSNIAGINSIGTTTLVLGGTSLTTTEASLLTGIVAGTATASKALIVNASRNIVNINSLSTTTLVLGGTSLTTTEATYLTGITAGTATASRALVLDGNKSITGINSISIDATVTPLIINNSSTTGRTVMRVTSDTKTWEIGSTGSANATFPTNSFMLYDSTAASVRLVVLTSGDIGIGKTNPGYKLDVNGSFNATSFNLSGTAVPLTLLTGVTAGTAAASKALTLDASSNVTGINSLTTTTLVLGATSLTSTQAAYLTGITIGTASASKSLVLDASSNVTGINSLGITTLVIGGTSLTTTQATYLTGITAGTALASKALILDASSNISGINSLGTTTLVLGSTSLTTTEAAYLTGITVGTALASKALILDASLNITGINSLSTTTLILGGTTITSTAAELNYVDITTIGTAQASKALIVDASKNITGINSLTTTTLVLGATSLTTTQAAYLTGITAGQAQASKAVILDATSGITNISSLTTTNNITSQYVNANNAFYSAKTSVSPTYVGSWGSASYFGIGPDTVTNNSTIRIGICNGSFAWTGYANLSCAGMNATSYSLNGSALDFSPVTGVTAGTASASKALIVDASRNISNIATLTSSGITTTMCYASNSYYNSKATGTPSYLGAWPSTGLFAIGPDSAAADSTVRIGISEGTNFSWTGYANVKCANMNATSFSLNGTALDFSSTTGVTAGTAVASKALVVDASRNIANINNITSTGYVMAVEYYVGNTQANVGALTGVNAGTAEASKALIIDASKNIVNINSITTTNLVLDTVTLTSVEAAYLTGNTAGTAIASKALVVDASRNITTINNISNTGYYYNGKNTGTASFMGNWSSSNYYGIGPDSATADSTIRLGICSGIGAWLGTYANLKCGNLNATSFSLSGSALDFSSITGVTAGTAAASKSLIVDASVNIAGINSLGTTTLVLGGTSLTTTQAAYLTGITVGTATASKALVLDASSNITGINSIGTTTLVLGGTSLTTTQAAYLTGITAGTALASKALILDASRNITNVNNFTSTGTIITSLKGNGLIHNDGTIGLVTFVNSTTLPTAAYFGTTTAHNLIFQTAGTVRCTLDQTGDVSATSFSIGANKLTSTQFAYLTSITAGTAAASKALILDSSRNITNIGSIAVTADISSSGGRIYTSGNFYAQRATASATYTGAWGSSNWWGIGPDTASTDSTIRVGVSDSFGVWTGALANVKCGNLNATSYSLSGTAVDFATITGVTSGTAAASKALIVDASVNISGINSLSVTSLTIGGTAITATAAELNFLDITTIGTAQASKALVLDASSNITGINSLSTTSLTLGGNVLGATQSAYLTGITPGTALASKALILSASRNITSINNVSVDNYVFSNRIAASASYIGNWSNTVWWGIGADTAVNDSVIRVGLCDNSGVWSGYANVKCANINATSFSLSGSAVDFSSISGVTAGTASASKALIVDASKNISGINNIANAASITTTSATAGYAPLTTTQTSGPTMQLYSNTTGYSYLGTTNAFAFAIQTNSVGRIFITSAGNVGVSTTPSASYALTTTTLNASSYYQGGSLYDISLTQYIAGVTFGTAAASKVLIPDASLNIAGLNSVSTTGLTVGNTSGGSNWMSVTSNSGRWQFLNVASGFTPAGALMIGAYNSVGTSLGDAITITQNLSVGINMTPSSSYKLDVNGAVNATTYYQAGSLVSFAAIAGVTAGTATASKALIVDASKNISGIGAISTANLSAASGIDTSSYVYVTNIGARAQYAGGWASTSYYGIGPDTATADNTVRIGITTSPNGTGAWSGYANLKCNLMYSTGYCLNGVNYNISLVDYIAGITLGTASASKCLITDSSNNIAGINSLSTTSLTLGGNVLGATQSGYLTGITAGTGAASKALILDSSKNIGSINGLSVASYVFNNQATQAASYVGNWVSSAYWGIGADSTGTDATVRIGTCNALGTWNGGFANVKCGTVYCTNTISYTLGSYAYFRSDALYNTGSSVTNSCSGYFVGRVVVGGELNVFSDYRVKNNVSNLSVDYCKKFICETRPVKFHYNNDATQAHFGYIAQEVKKLGFDDLITMAPNDKVEEILEEDGFLNPKGYVFTMSTTELIPLLAVNIKELYKENEELKAKIIASEAKSIENENKINKLEDLVNSLINRLNALENK